MRLRYRVGEQADSDFVLIWPPGLKTIVEVALVFLVSLVELLKLVVSALLIDEWYVLLLAELDDARKRGFMLDLAFVAWVVRIL